MRETGYFGNPVTGRSGKVHTVIDREFAACGSRVGGEFYFCAPDTRYEYLTCAKCRRLAVQEARRVPG